MLLFISVFSLIIFVFSFPLWSLSPACSVNWQQTNTNLTSYNPLRGLMAECYRVVHLQAQYMWECSVCVRVCLRVKVYKLSVCISMSIFLVCDCRE